MYTMPIKTNFVFSVPISIEQSYSCFNYIKENLVLASNTLSTGIILLTTESLFSVPLFLYKSAEKLPKSQKTLGYSFS